MCKFTRDVKYHDMGACKFTRDVKCHDTCQLCTWRRLVLARGYVHTKKSTRIIAQATRRCSCTGYSLNYFDSAYYTTDSRAYSVVGHIECQTRSGLLTSLLLIHLVHTHSFKGTLTPCFNGDLLFICPPPSICSYNLFVLLTSIMQ